MRRLVVATIFRPLASGFCTAPWLGAHPAETDNGIVRMPLLGPGEVAGAGIHHP